MSKVALFPRLNHLGVREVVENRRFAEGTSASISELAQFTSYGPSGGSRNESAPLHIGQQLRRLAREVEDQKDKFALFDEKAAKVLGVLPLLACGESLRDDVWAFLACAVAPDVVAWRFPDLAPERFAGGVRNTFQRLWARGITLDRGAQHPARWELLSSLTEDAFVQIFERPSVGGNRRLARAVAETWLKTSQRVGRGAMEALMRRAVKIIRIRNEITDISLLSDDELAQSVEQAFSLAEVAR